MSNISVIELINEIFIEKKLILAVLSSPLKKSEIIKVMIRPVLVKGHLLYQVSSYSLNQVNHKNLTTIDSITYLHLLLEDYKQIFFYTKMADYQILTNKKQKMTLLTKPASKVSHSLTHNRKKEYLLQEGMPIPFLIRLGLMNSQGKVIAQKSDKFRQINRFLEMIDDILPHLNVDKLIRIIDFGCGKAYLTFALYYYLKHIKQLNVKICGLDLKSDVIAFCQNLSKELDYAEDLNFELGEISSYQTDQQVDIVISLHACDIATDAALAQAIKWQAKVILAVPCCQHELYQQLGNKILNPLLKHGILKERFAALATDALRAQLLEICGYQAKIVEFIDLEHTPKNILIRAVRVDYPENSSISKKEAYLEMTKALQVKPTLETLLGKIF